jgi:hypothetical protein
MRGLYGIHYVYKADVCCVYGCMHRWIEVHELDSNVIAGYH